MGFLLYGYKHYKLIMEGYGSYFKNLRVIFTPFHVTIVDAEIWGYFDFVRKNL